METSTPAPEDVNTLLVLTRELTKQIPEGSSFLPTFNGFNVGDMGLPEDGDVIIDYEGVPHIVTQFGKFLHSWLKFFNTFSQLENIGTLWFPYKKVFFQKALKSDFQNQSSM